MSEIKKVLTEKDFSDRSITEVIIDEDVERVEAAALGDCHELKTVYFNAISCKTTGTGKQNAFGKSGVISMYDEVYYKKYTKVDTFVIGNKVKRLPKYIFAGTDITSITIPASVEEIEDAAFCDVPMLKDIIVDSQNKIFAVENGILINKKTGKMICVPGKIKMPKVYAIPETINEVSEYAFDNRGTNPMEIHFPKHVAVPKNKRLNKRKIIVDGISEIVSDEFHEIIDGKLIKCTMNAREHTLPAGIKTIGERAFANARVFSKLVIPSTVEQIDSAAFESSWTSHVVLLNPKIKCAKAFLKNSEVRLLSFFDNRSKKTVTVYLPINASAVRRQRAITALGINTKGGFDFDLDEYRNLNQIPKEEQFFVEYFANRDIDPDRINVRNCMKPGIEEAIKRDMLTIDDFKILYETENLTKTNIKYIIEYAENYNKPEIADYLKSLKV